MAEYPLDHLSSPSPTSFAHLLADVWWTLYPIAEIPRYQVTPTTIGGSMLEYSAKVLMSSQPPHRHARLQLTRWIRPDPRSCRPASCFGRTRRSSPAGERDVSGSRLPFLSHLDLQSSADRIPSAS